MALPAGLTFSGGAKPQPVTFGPARPVSTNSPGLSTYRAPSPPPASPQAVAVANQFNQQKMYQQPQAGPQQVLGASVQSPFDQAQNDADVQRQRELDAINAEFEANMGFLGGLEQTSQANYEDARGQIEGQLPSMIAGYEKDQSGRLAQIGEQEISEKQNAERARGENTRLLGDLQRKNAARLAATGASNSSVAAALAEQFGRQAFSANSRVQQERDRVLKGLQTQATQVRDFYSSKIAEAKSSTQEALNQLAVGLRNTLANIQGQKGAAAAAKAQSTAEAWRNYINQRNQINLEAFNFQNNLEMWKQQMAGNLQAAAAKNFGKVEKGVYQLITDALGDPTGTFDTGTGQFQRFATDPTDEEEEEEENPLVSNIKSLGSGIASFFNKQ